MERISPRLDTELLQWSGALIVEHRRSQDATVRDAWVSWATVYGSFAETREEAAEALAEAPKNSKPSARAGLFVDFTTGKTLALAGRVDEALPLLKRVASTCATFDAPMQLAKKIREVLEEQESGSL